MQKQLFRRLCPWIVVLGLALFLGGCGGGGAPTAVQNPGGSPPAVNTNSVTKFDVNTSTGKVTLSHVDPSGRAILIGNAVSFSSSDLISVPGDSGTRVLRISVSNLSGQTLAPNARLVISNLSNTSAVSLPSQATVTTLAGNGLAGSGDGAAPSASFQAPNGLVVDPTGTQLYVDDTLNHTVRLLGNDGNTRTFAGTAGASGTANGAGSAARFNRPDQIARDSQGDLFVADTVNCLIRRITPLGEVTTIAGNNTVGNGNGPSTADQAAFNEPQGIAVSTDGNRIYVAELNDIRLVTYITGPRNLGTSYTVTTVAGGVTAGYVDSVSGAAPLFDHPYHLALATEVTGNETLYVTDLLNHAIRRIDNPAGLPVVSTIAGGNGAGNVDGPGSSAAFNQPKGIAALSNGQGATTLFVTEANHQIRMITSAGSDPAQRGSYLVQTLAGTASAGFANGDGTSARFHDPAGITALPIPGNSATLYVADSNNNRIRKIVVSSGALSSGSGSGATTETVRLLNFDSEIPNQNAWAKNLNPQTGSPGDLQFFSPNGVSGFSFTAYVEADSNLINLPANSATTVTTLAGDGQAGLFNGPGKLAEFSQPVGIASSGGNTALGNYRAFVTERANRLIRAIDSNGNVTTFAGGGANTGDGPANQAAITDPFGIAMGPDGSLYFTDLNGGKVRRIAMVGGTLKIGTIAGTGAAAGTDGAGSAVAFNQPAGIAVDQGGTIYITEFGGQTVRKITYLNGDPMAAASYSVVTLAGAYQTPGFADGTGSSARFNRPNGIAVDTDGKVYVADGSNNTIRALTRSGSNTVNVTTLAGQTGTTGGTDGIGSAARFNLPSGLTLDTAHNLYVSEFGSHRMRRVSPQGSVVTLVGSVAGFGDGANGTFNGPYMISLEPAGNLLVVDYYNNAIRVVQRIVSEGQSSIRSVSRQSPAASLGSRSVRPSGRAAAQRGPAMR